MEKIIEYVKSQIGRNRDAESARKAILILAKKTKNIRFEIPGTYYVSEWSNNRFTDGNYPCKEYITKEKDLGATRVYSTNSPYSKTYFPWDLFENEPDCQRMCDFKNSFALNWETKIQNFTKQINEEA